MLTSKGRFQSIRFWSKEGEGRRVLALEDGGRYLINPGSVGQPRDGDWRAAFAILDQEQRQVEYYRTAYDLPETQEKMRKAGLPEPLIKRLELGRSCPTEYLTMLSAPATPSSGAPRHPLPQGGEGCNSNQFSPRPRRGKGLGVRGSGGLAVDNS